MIWRGGKHYATTFWKQTVDPVEPSGCDLERLGGQHRAEDRGRRCGVQLV